jgi:hypothetical protein
VTARNDVDPDTAQRVVNVAFGNLAVQPDKAFVVKNFIEPALAMK